MTMPAQNRPTEVPEHLIHPGIARMATLDDHAEIATRLMGDGMAFYSADVEAAAQLGFHDGDALRQAVRLLWRDTIRAAIPLGKPGEDLKRTALKLFEAGVIRDAVACGWSDVDMFGVHPVLPFSGASFGVTAATAFSVRTRRVAAIDKDGATLISASGHQVMHRRTPATPETVPFWEAALFSK